MSAARCNPHCAKVAATLYQETQPSDRATSFQAVQGNGTEQYSEVVARLQALVEQLEGGGLSLEESIAAFEEGIQLARAGAQKLEEAERKVETLLENDRTAPFAPDEVPRR